MNLPVRIRFDHGTISGQCREISQEGMCLELQDALSANDQGTASIGYEAALLEVGVCVTHAEGCGGGLKFVFHSDRQRMEMARLVAQVAACSEPAAGPVLLK